MSKPWRRTGAVEVKLHSFLTSMLQGSKWLTLTPAALPSEKKAGPTKYIEVWVPQTVLTFCRGEKSLALTGILTVDCPFLSLNVLSKLFLIYHMTRDTSHAVAGGDPFGTHMVTDGCVHIPEYTNYCELEPEDASYCMLLLSQQHRLGLVHSYSLEL